MVRTSSPLGENEWLAHDEAVRLSGLSLRTFQRREAAGILECERVGRRKFYLRRDVLGVAKGKRPRRHLGSLTLSRHDVVTLQELVGPFELRGRALIAAVARTLRAESKRAGVPVECATSRPGAAP